MSFIKFASCVVKCKWIKYNTNGFNTYVFSQSVRGYVLLKAPQPIHLFSKQSRAFKRVKWQETKHEFDPSTPFGQTPVDVGKLSLGSLWKPLGFTIGVRHNKLQCFTLKNLFLNIFLCVVYRSMLCWSSYMAVWKYAA